MEKTIIENSSLEKKDDCSRQASSEALAQPFLEFVTNPKSLERALALSNLAKKPYRTLCLSLLSALSAGILFASLLLSSCLKGGISGLTSRLGADLLVVPEGYEKGAENILLYGEPSYFYMDSSVLDAVSSIDGVKKASAQFYLTSLSESCCDFPIQLIGFDPESDFVVKNWARSKKYGKKAGKNKSIEEEDSVSENETLLCGANITTENNTVRFFGQSHIISSKLSKSGSGMDNVIFCDLTTLQEIFSDAEKKGFGFISDGDTKNKISTVLVQMDKNTYSDTLALQIKNAVEGVQVIQGDKFLRIFSEKLFSFLIFLRLIALLVFLICAFSLALVYSVTINERHREFSILRVLGADRSLLKRILFWEALISSSAGSVSGTALAALFIIPFSSLISQKIALPFLSKSPLEILVFALAAIAASTLSCLLASLSGAVKVSKMDVYGDVK